MNNYTLSQSETILYKGTVTDCIDGNYADTDAQMTAELVLTNENIVFIKKVKKLLRTKTVTEVYSIKDIKVYEETIQILRKEDRVNIFITNAEKFLVFENEKEAKDFTDKALKLISGDSKIIRGFKKAKKAVEDAVGEEVVEVAKEIVKAAGNVAIDMAAEADNKKVRYMGKVAQKVSLKKKSDCNLLNEADTEKTLELPEHEEVKK